MLKTSRPLLSVAPAKAGSSSCLRRNAHHDVEPGREFAEARAFERDERDSNGLPRLLVFDPLINAVLLVSRMALDVTLGDQFLAALQLDRVVNVGCASRIGHRLDGPEQILTSRTGQEAAEALEILVPILAVAGLAVQVGAVVVALPDFNQRVANR